MGAGSDIGAGIGGMIGSVGGMLAGLLGDSGDDERQRVLQLWNQLQLPGFDMSSLSAPELRIVAEYFPEYYEANLPGEAALTQDSPEVRQSLAENLDYFESVRDQGLPLAERLAAQDAQRSLGQAYRANVQSGLSNLQQRGRAGGGAEAALRLGAAQQGSELARGMSSDLVQQAIQNRMNAAGNLANAGTTLRGQDISLSARNADTLNRFNTLMSQMLTDQARENSARQQEAQWANTSRAQQVSDANALASYQSQAENINRQNTLAQQNFANRTTQTAGQTGALQDVARGDAASLMALRDNIYGLGGGLGQTVGGMLDYGTATNEKDSKKKDNSA